MKCVGLRSLRGGPLGRSPRDDDVTFMWNTLSDLIRPHFEKRLPDLNGALFEINS
jgi:hypothetical protein